jgi:hypothetical protein
MITKLDETAFSMELDAPVSLRAGTGNSSFPKKPNSQFTFHHIPGRHLDYVYFKIIQNCIRVLLLFLVYTVTVLNLHIYPPGTYRTESKTGSDLVKLGSATYEAGPCQCQWTVTEVETT